MVKISSLFSESKQLSVIGRIKICLVETLMFYLRSFEMTTYHASKMISRKLNPIFLSLVFYQSDSDFPSLSSCNFILPKCSKEHGWLVKSKVLTLAKFSKTKVTISSLSLVFFEFISSKHFVVCWKMQKSDLSAKTF